MSLVSALSRFAEKSRLPDGPVAVILAEDGALIPETVEHCKRIGFRTVILVRDERVSKLHAGAGRCGPPDGVTVLTRPCRGAEAARACLAALLRGLAGRWVFWCYNAEFLFFPHCGTRRITDLLRFCDEERRESVHGCVVDLYAPDPGRDPDGISLERAQFDAIGYHAGPVWSGGEVAERQVALFGGLARRYAEHVPEAARRIDRIPLVRPTRRDRMGDRLRFDRAELNTISCPWHRNVTVALMSFRLAKALRRNPGPAAGIGRFDWAGSRAFNWQPDALLDVGLMETGQWF